MTNEQIIQYAVEEGFAAAEIVDTREIVFDPVKTSRAAAKRFKKTGTGQLKRMKAYKSHILTKKSQKRKRNLRKSTLVDATNVKSMKKILPYL